MKQISTIDIFNDRMKFSSGHFTIFSSTQREDMHGHNYHVKFSITFEVDDNGLTFDYRFYKQKLYQLCEQLNRKMLFPTNSTYLSIEENTSHYTITFNDESMELLKRDVKLMPLVNITIEELSRWFIEQLTADKEELEKHSVQRLEVKIGSTPEQTASALWHKTEA